MNPEMKILMKLTEENTRMKCALSLMKQLRDEDIKSGYSGNLNDDEVNMILNISGLNSKEVNVITFDNCEDSAYES